MDKEKSIKDGQFRKGLSIAYFNATNAAVTLIASEERLRFGIKETLDNLRIIRDALLEDHLEYYSKTVASVGSNFKPADTIAKLEKSINIESLRSVFLSLSQDERNNPEILKRANELKAQYENAQ